MVNELDSQGYSPLFLACFKGYIGAESIVSKAASTKDSRMRCVKALVGYDADINFVVNKVNMSALHWAAYNDDAAVCEYLLKQPGINMVFSAGESTPVDIAGMMGYEGVVNKFIDNLEEQIEHKYWCMFDIEDETAKSQSRNTDDNPPRKKLDKSQIDHLEDYARVGAAQIL